METKKAPERMETNWKDTEKSGKQETRTVSDATIDSPDFDTCSPVNTKLHAFKGVVLPVPGLHYRTQHKNICTTYHNS